jgi:hypothetical protein
MSPSGNGSMTGNQHGPPGAQTKRRGLVRGSDPPLEARAVKGLPGACRPFFVRTSVATPLEEFLLQGPGPIGPGFSAFAPLP